MDESILRENLKRLMKEQNLSMLKLSLLACLNETAVRDILNGKVKSPTYHTLYQLAKVLNCKPDDLAMDPTDDNLSYQGKSLLFNNSRIDLEIFADAIIKIDQDIQELNLKIKPIERAKMYFAYYDNILIDKYTKNSHT